MSVSIIILSSGIVAAICASIISSLFHRIKWFRRIKKSRLHILNLAFTSFYQYNGRFYHSFPLLRELMFCTLTICLIYKNFISQECFMEVRYILGAILLTIIISAILQLIVYIWFYDEKLVK